MVVQHLRKARAIVATRVGGAVSGSVKQDATFGERAGRLVGPATSRRVVLGLGAAGALLAGAYIVRRKGWPRFTPAGMPAGPFTLAPVEGLIARGGSPLPSFSRADIERAVSVVNVWASWCPYCRSEHQTLMEFAKSEQTPFFGLVYEDTADKARSYLSAAGVPYDALGVDENRRYTIALGIVSVPTTVVLDRRGTVVKSLQGPLTPDRIRTDLLPAIEAARVRGV
jgi:cytochrome c biogenesis protein CcmG/thiol:disulfide interchange protein DsbE